MSNLRQAAAAALEAIESDTVKFSAWTEKMLSAATALRAALAEPEQPHDLLCVCGAVWDIYSDGREELVTAPTPRKPLTDEELRECWDQVGNNETVWAMRVQFARAIERAHGIKGEQA